MATTKKRGRPTKSAAQRERERAKKIQQQKNRARVLSIMLIALGAFLCALTWVAGENLWLKMHEVLFGLFGVMAYAVGPMVLLIAFMTAYERQLSRPHVILGLLTLFAACGAVLIFGDTALAGETAGEQFVGLYHSGVLSSGGGAASFLLGWTLLRAFGKTGAGVTIIILLFVCVMLLTGKTISGILGGIRKAALAAKERSEQQNAVREEIREARLKEQQEKRQQRQAEQEKKEQQAKERATRTKIDIPLDPEPPKQPPLEVPMDFNTGKTVSTPEDILPVVPPENDPADPEHINDVIKDIKSSFEQEHSLEITDEKPAEKPAENKENTSKYKYPPISLLKKTSAGRAVDIEKEQRATAQKLVSTLNSFGVKTRVMDITRGPTVTRYELQPAQGVKVSRISGLADDIALNLAAGAVRIEAPIPNKAAVGIEVPNQAKNMVGLRSIIESEKFRASKAPLTIALGLDIEGQIRIADIAEMPHMLVAGTTGSGKSVCLNSIILSLIFKSSPDDVRMILIDPKSVELIGYNGIPHLLVPVVTDAKKSAGALTWAVSEMMKRYRLFAEASVKTLDSYNRKVEQQLKEFKESGEETAEMPSKLPHIVIIIDELSDLMMVAPNDVEDAICRLAQLARAAGMHLIVATQRPTVDVVTGLIKANIPSRVAFAVKTSIDSRTIIGISGAEMLLGKGDMLYMPIELNKPVRLQGCFVSDDEIENVVKFLKSSSEQQYSEQAIEEIDSQEVHEKRRGQAAAATPSDGKDAMLDAAIEVVVEAGQASTSLLQRRLKLGYARAARIVDEMEQMGIVGQQDGSKPRTVNMTRNQWLEMKMRKDAEGE